MALRLLATIWSSGRRWGNCGSSSRQNSQGRLERVSKRFTTAGSMCSTKCGSWQRRKRIHPVCEAESQFFASTATSVVWTTPLYYKGWDLYKPLVASANFLLFPAFAMPQLYRKGRNRGDVELRFLA